MGRKTICSSCGKILESSDKCDCKKTAKIKPKPKYNEGDSILSTYRWRKKREYIRERDGHMCQRCLIKYGQIVTRSLSVHHIKSRKDFPELTWDNDNLICICQSCNSQLGTSNVLDFEWNGAKINDYSL